MPIVHAYLNATTRPDWCTMTGAGIFRIPRAGGCFDRHYHDCDEYWLVFQGKAKVRSEGQEFYVQAGDIVCTQKGQEHDIIEIYEDLAAFWLEDATLPGGLPGHLHRDAAAARGHAVPAAPLPADFPC